MTLSDRTLRVQVSDEYTVMELFYSPLDGAYDPARLYVVIKDWSRVAETVIGLTVADMRMIYNMLAEALGQDKEASE